MNIQGRPMTSIQQVQNERLNKGQSKQQVNVSQGIGSFDQILQQQIGKTDEVKFSKHANQRLESRQISLTNEQMLRLQNGVNSAQEKGIKESLVLMDEVALVVNVENKTVVTALSKQESREHVFTNIDGAVVI